MYENNSAKWLREMKKYDTSSLSSNIISLMDKIEEEVFYTDLEVIKVIVNSIVTENEQIKYVNNTKVSNTNEDFSHFADNLINIHEQNIEAYKHMIQGLYSKDKLINYFLNAKETCEANINHINFVLDRNPLDRVSLVTLGNNEKDLEKIDLALELLNDKEKIHKKTK